MGDNKTNSRESYILGLTFLIVVVVNLLLYLFATFYYARTEKDLSFIMSVLLSEAAIVVPAIVYVKKKGMTFVEGIGLKKVKFGTVMKALLVAFLAMPVASFVNVLTQFFVPNTMTQAADNISASGTVVALIFSSIIGPLCEEIAFRGAFFNGYKKISGILPAIIISSVFFGIIHLNLNQMAYAIVLGVIFCIINVASGSIITSCIVHFVVNFSNIAALLWVNAVSTEIGSSALEQAEEMRADSSQLVIVAVAYGIASIITIVCMIPVIRSIAKKEGNYDIYRAVFSKKYREKLAGSESAEVSEEIEAVMETEAELTSSESVISWPAIAAIVIGLAFIIVAAAWGSEIGDYLINIFS